MPEDNDSLYAQAKMFYEAHSKDWRTRIEWAHMTEEQKELWFKYTERRINYIVGD